MEKQLTSLDCVSRKEHVIFFAQDERKIVSLEKATGRMKFLPMFGTELIEEMDRAIIVEDVIYFLEMGGRNLMEYSVENNHYKLHPIDCDGGVDANFSLLFHQEDHLYIVATKRRKIVQFNLKTKETQHWEYPRLPDGMEFVGATFQNDKIWVFPRHGDRILSFHIRTKKWTEWCLDQSLSDIVYADSLSDAIILLTASGGLLKWDLTCYTMSDLVLGDTDATYEQVYARTVVLEDMVFLLPCHGWIIKRYDILSGEMEVIDEFGREKQLIEGREHWTKFYGYCEDEEWIYFACRVMMHYLKISKRTGETKWYKPIPPSVCDYMLSKIEDSERVRGQKKVQIEENYSKSTMEGKIGTEIWNNMAYHLE